MKDTNSDEEGDGYTTPREGDSVVVVFPAATFFLVFASTFDQLSVAAVQ